MSNEGYAQLSSTEGNAVPNNAGRRGKRDHHGDVGRHRKDTSNDKNNPVDAPSPDDIISSSKFLLQ